MSWLKALTRPSIRNYTLFLCAFYLLLVFLFHSRLQFTTRSVSSGESQAEYDNGPVQGKELDYGALPTPKSGADLDQFDVLLRKTVGDFKGGSVGLPRTTVRPMKHGGIRTTFKPLHDRYKGAGNLFQQDRFKNCHGPKAPEEFDFKEPNPSIKIFSGYWDSRENDFDNQYGGVKIRLITAIAGKNYRPSLKCFFKVDGYDRATLVTYYEMCENHNRRWGGYILSCEVPPEIQNQTLCSIRVSLDLELNSEAIVTTVPVYSIADREKRYNFAMCVPPMFGNIRPAKLIEFFEFSFHLGAEHIMLYNFSLSDSSMKTIQHYVDQGKVTVIPWNLPLILDKSMWYHGQSMAIQDCLYRHMGISEYVTFNDIDEFLIPNQQVGDKWKHVIERYNNEKICGYKFRSAFFDPKHDMLKPLDRSVGHFPSLVTALNHRSKMLSHVRTKCMVKPKKIFEMGIHHISKPVMADLQGLDIGSNDAVLNHYRACLPGFGMNCRDHSQDDSALRFGRVIYEKVVKARALIEYKETIR